MENMWHSQRFLLCGVSLLLMVFGALDSESATISGYYRENEVKGCASTPFKQFYEWNVFCSPCGNLPLTKRCRTGTCNGLTHDGAFYFADMPNPPGTLFFDQPNFYCTPKVFHYTGTNHNVAPNTDYFVAWGANWDDWGNDPWETHGGTWYQSFVATGYQINRVAFKLAAPVNGDVRVVIHESNGGSITSWPPRSEPRLVNANCHGCDLWVGWHPGVQTVPGRTYAVSLANTTGGHTTPFIRYESRGCGYSSGTAYRDNTPAAGDLFMMIFSDNDGTTLTYQMTTPNIGHSGEYAGACAQSFTARGTSLAGVGIFAAGSHDGQWPAHVLVYDGISHGGQHGNKVGPTKHLEQAAWFGPGIGYGAVSFCPGEVPLNIGQRYLVVFSPWDAEAGAGISPLNQGNAYAGGSAYMGAGGDWAIRDYDFSMSIVEYLGGHIPPTNTPAPPATNTPIYQPTNTPIPQNTPTPPSLQLCPTNPENGNFETNGGAGQIPTGWTAFGNNELRTRNSGSLGGVPPYEGNWCVGVEVYGNHNEDGGIYRRFQVNNGTCAARVFVTFQSSAQTTERLRIGIDKDGGTSVAGVDSWSAWATNSGAFHTQWVEISTNPVEVNNGWVTVFLNHTVGNDGNIAIGKFDFVRLSGTACPIGAAPTATNTPVIIPTSTHTATPYQQATPTPGSSGCPLVSQSKPAFASSTHNSSVGPEKAVDGLVGYNDTRWVSAADTHHWLYVDLGQVYDLCEVKVYSEEANIHGDGGQLWNITSYQIRGSNTAGGTPNEWLVLASYWNECGAPYPDYPGDGINAHNTHQVSGAHRYVAITIDGGDGECGPHARLQELQVFGSATTQPTPTPTGSFCMGDANRDGFVNGDDFRSVRDNFGANRCGIGDANGDCFVNGEDFRVVRDNFGTPCN